VCDYLYFNLKYKDVTDVPEFDIPPEMALELLVAADYLDGMFSKNAACGFSSRILTSSLTKLNEAPFL
jgi:transcription elongation factor B subunit 1